MSEKKQTQNKNNQEQKKSMADGLFDMFNPNNMINNAQKVISSAVNVLEEEIAAGILAAKNIEKKVFDTNEISDNPNNLMSRIRKDTHEALDIFLDAFSALSKQIGVLTDTVSKTNNTKTEQSSPSPKNNNNLQILEQDESVKAGSKISFHFTLSDDDIEQPLKINLQKTDFIGVNNQKILSRFIQIKPTSFLLNPKEEKEILITVDIPKTCKVGHYNALLNIPQIHAVKIVLALQVK